MKDLRVLARSTPRDKYILVCLLKKIGKIVAVTGDGTNDAPALKKANIGIAMGITGTEVARSASDMILLDDNFSSIVKGCLWGRNIYDSVRKFLTFQLTANFVAVSFSIIGSLILQQSPFSMLQMLWINVIMDAFASLALATDVPQMDLMNRAPYKLESNIISPLMIRNILLQGIYQLFVLLLNIFMVPSIFSIPKTRDMDVS